jgi:hypothetical protein
MLPDVIKIIAMRNDDSALAWADGTTPSRHQAEDEIRRQSEIARIIRILRRNGLNCCILVPAFWDGRKE